MTAYASVTYLLSSCQYFIFEFFFFKQKTAYEMRISDWSSDVCSSDLAEQRQQPCECGDEHESAADAEQPGEHAGDRAEQWEQQPRDHRSITPDGSDRKSVV